MEVMVGLKEAKRLSKHITVAIYPETKEKEILFNLEKEFFLLAQKKELTSCEERRVDELEDLLIEKLWKPEQAILQEENVIVAEA
jgi:hypothetical protein